ncbi:hypothetical protein SAMN05428976_102372 [Clostridium sp. USBA 49]|uniref:hypothetical protein n=1 Tax=Clostridium TaxID=1485 RepID=UPI00099A5316|nr:MULTISPECIES: hypothetical protein [Clostridium]SKA76851.1 hypothetical protein SAMN05428976_102372 [Clostridium sp. USBA 49]
MKNLNFMTITFNENLAKSSLKIKNIEKYILLLWIGCIIMFLLFMYNKNKNNKTMEIYNANYREMSNTILNQSNIYKNNKTLNNFKNFIINFNDNLNYKDVNIKENIIDINLSVNNKQEYINFIEKIEKFNIYKIIFLSPLNNDGEKFNFTISLEVKL